MRARGWKLRWKIVIRADGYYRDARFCEAGRYRERKEREREFENRSRAASPLGRKNDVCTDTRITSE